MEIDHRVQLIILKQLLFNPRARFAKLNKSGLTNDHFTFHLKRLIELGLVEKVDSLYRLTSAGLEVAGRLDVKSLKIIKQPKVGVLIGLTRKNMGQTEVLLGERLRDPGKGRVGFYAKKVKFGESLFDTCRRCLVDETGLTADFAYAGVVHILDKKRKDPQIDRLMSYFLAKNISGRLKKKTKEARNLWVTYSEAYKLKNRFKDLVDDLDLFKKKEIFFEERYISE